MSVVDKILGWLLVVFGAVHTVEGIAHHHTFSANGAWFFGTGVALVAAGFLNVARARKPDVFMRVACVITNAMLVLIPLALMFTMGRGALHSWHLLAITGVIVLELIIAAGR
jgi:hypothetical protein